MLDQEPAQRKDRSVQKAAALKHGCIDAGANVTATARLPLRFIYDAYMRGAFGMAPASPATAAIRRE
jgi:hypothetical protein